MNPENFASLLYLGLLGAVVGGYFLLNNRHRMGKMAQQAAIWGMIFVGIAASYGLWGDIRDDSYRSQASLLAGGEIVVPRARDGHYYLTLQINDTPVKFIVDTGATEMVLSLPDADRIGIDHDNLPFLGRANTANGSVKTAMVRLDEVRLGDVVDHNVTAQISSGEMPGSLLGMGYLGKFDKIEIANNKLVLSR